MKAYLLELKTTKMKKKQRRQTTLTSYQTLNIKCSNENTVKPPNSGYPK